MFGILGNLGGSGQAAQTPATAAAPASAQTPTQVPTQVPAAQQQGAMPAAQQPAPPAAEPVRNADLYSLLIGEQQAQQPQQTPEQQQAERVNAAMQAILGSGAQQGRNAETGAPAINPDKLAAALPSMNLTGGIDFAALVEGLNGEKPAEAMQTFAATVQQNTVMAIVPIINELMRQGIEAARTAAVTETHHNLTSSGIVTAFNERYPYGANPAISGMLTRFANELAQSAPRNATAAQLADALHNMMQTIGGAVQPQAGGHAATRAPLQDMSGIFR